MDATSRLALAKIVADPAHPETADAVSALHQAINDHANKLDTAGIFLHGLAGDRPPAGVADRYYFATDSGVLSRDSGTAWANVIGPQPFVTTLPATPVDGEECTVVADDANDVIYELKWRAASSKWTVLGAGALESKVATSETTSDVGNADLATVGPQIVVPFSGDFIVDYGAFGFSDGDGFQSWAVLVNKSTSTQLDEIVFRSAQEVYSHRRIKVSGIAGGQTLAVQYRTSAGRVGTFGNRILHIEPSRLS